MEQAILWQSGVDVRVPQKKWDHKTSGEMQTDRNRPRWFQMGQFCLTNTMESKLEEREEEGHEAGDTDEECSWKAFDKVLLNRLTGWVRLLGSHHG